MPFFFEGRRRRDQAETALNQLAVLSNALVTFDDNRMGELVLAKQGIHEAFSAADKMISESIKAVIRLVVRPGLINVGLDDLMSALRTTRSRCLFGSGIADGKDRAAKALRNALASPLLDQGSLLKDAQTVLVHLSGGESLTLFEIELLMQNLQKYVPEKAHVLFGAAIDPTMGDNLSITLISALPEDALTSGGREMISKPMESPIDFSKPAEEPVIENPFSKIDRPEQKTAPENPAESESENTGETTEPESEKSDPEPQAVKESPADDEPETQTPPEKEERPFAEPELIRQEEQSSAPEKEKAELKADIETEERHVSAVPEPKRRPAGKPLWGKKGKTGEDDSEDPFEDDLSEEKESNSPSSLQLKLDPKQPSPQSELAFDNTPKGRFEGENPNVFEGEDLDLPPFLRKKRS